MRTPGPSGVTIRDAVADDIDALSAMLVTTWHDTYDPLIGAGKVTEITSSWHSPAALLPQLAIPHAAFLVAEQDGAIVGHAFANALRLPALAIGRLYVLPTHQRLGIGKRLLDAAIARYPQAERVGLDVEADNAKGFAFYRREGFVPLREHLQEGIRHIRMEKVLAAR